MFFKMLEYGVVRVVGWGVAGYMFIKVLEWGVVSCLFIRVQGWALVIKVRVLWCTGGIFGCLSVEMDGYSIARVLGLQLCYLASVGMLRQSLK